MNKTKIANRRIEVYEHADGTTRLREGFVTVDDFGEVNGRKCAPYLEGKLVMGRAAYRETDGTGWIIGVDRDVYPPAPLLLTGRVECLIDAEWPTPETVAP